MPRKSKYDRIDNVTPAELIEAAHADVEALRDEIEDVAANLEERFSNTSRFETLSETRDQLSEVADDSVPSLPEGFATATVAFRWRYEPRASRADRRDAMIARLETARDEIANLVEAGSNDEVDEVLDTLERWIDTLQACEFPGMMG